MYKWDIDNKGEGISNKKNNFTPYNPVNVNNTVRLLISGDDKKEDHEAGDILGGSQRSRGMRTPEGVQGKIWTHKETRTEAEK